MRALAGMPSLVFVIQVAFQTALTMWCQLWVLMKVSEISERQENRRMWTVECRLLMWYGEDGDCTTFSKCDCHEKRLTSRFWRRRIRRSLCDDIEIVLESLISKVHFDSLRCCVPHHLPPLPPLLPRPRSSRSSECRSRVFEDPGIE